MLTRKARNKKIYCQLKHHLDANLLKNKKRNKELIVFSSSSCFYILKYLYIHRKSKGAKERLLGQTLKTKILATISNYLIKIDQTFPPRHRLFDSPLMGMLPDYLFDRSES